MNIARKVALAAVIVASAAGAHFQHEAHAASQPPPRPAVATVNDVTGSWHIEGAWIGTQWCVFLESPTGVFYLWYCNPPQNARVQ